MTEVTLSSENPKQTATAVIGTAASLQLQGCETTETLTKGKCMKTITKKTRGLHLTVNASAFVAGAWVGLVEWAGLT